MDNEKLLDRVRKDLRSVLISAPRGVPIRMLIRDFKTVLGYELPYRQFSFQTVEDFVRKVPDVARISSGVTGEPTCFAVADQCTSQIARFVASQKKPKIKRSNAPPLLNKPVFSGFTKKSKFGPSFFTMPGIRKKSGQGRSRGGKQMPPRFQNYAPVAPPYHYQQQQQQRSYQSYGSSAEPGRTASSSYLLRSSVQNSKPSSGRPVSSGGSSNIMAKPEQKAKAPRSGSFSSLIWDPNLSRNQNCPFLTIQDLTDKAKNNLIKEDTVISSSGFIASPPRYDNHCIKYFLYNGYDDNGYDDTLKHGMYPALMLHFCEDSWKHEADIKNIPIGCKLKVYGSPITIPHKTKDINSPAIRVYHCTYEIPLIKTAPSISIPSASKNIDKCIFDLLKHFDNGVWKGRLGKQFTDYYKFDAPENIVEIALKLPFVKEEEITTDNYILNLKDGVSPPTSPSGGASPPSSLETSKKRPGSGEQEPKTRVSYTMEKPALPETVEFSTSDYFDVYVISINNPISFYLQRSGEGYSNKLDAMHDKMTGYFTQNSVKPMLGVAVDGLYGYKWEVEGESNFWCRALVSYLTGDSAGVYFPDYGNSEVVKVKELMDLPREFYQLPFQAVHCCLHGCSSVREEASRLFVEHALDKNCVAQIMDSSGTRLAVELIESDSASGDTINSIIMSALHPLDTLRPQLPKSGDVRVPVILTDVDEDGIITVQLNGPGINRLAHLMNIINEKYKKSVAADFLRSVDVGNVYCTQFPSDKKFYRVMVKKAVPGKILVEYVDYGNEAQTEITRLRKPVSDPLFNLPFQAVKCRLHGLPPEMDWSEGMTNFVDGFMDSEDLYLTVMSPGTEAGDLPRVKLILTSGEEDTVLNDLLSEMSDADTEYSSGLDDDAASTTVSLPSTPSILPTAQGIHHHSTSQQQKHRSLSLPGDEGILAPGLSGSLGQAFISPKKFDAPPGFMVPSGGTVSPFTPRSSPSVTVPTSPVFKGGISISSKTSLSSSGLVPYSSSSGSNQSPPRTLVAETLSKDLSSMQIGSSSQSSASPPGSLVGVAGAVDVSGGATVGVPSGIIRNKYSFASLSSEKPEAVTVSWLESPHNFVVSLLSEADTLMDLTTRLREIMEGSFPKLKVIRENMVCCAQSTLDNSWYRVRLVSMPSPASTLDIFDVTVEFLDFGGVEVVKSSNLRAMPDEDEFEYPFQGISCTLQGVEPLNPEDPRQWSTGALTWFEQHVLENSFFALELNKENGRSCITLLDTSTGKTVDIRDILKKEGFATLQTY